MNKLNLRNKISHPVRTLMLPVLAMGAMSAAVAQNKPLPDAPARDIPTQNSDAPAPLSPLGQGVMTAIGFGMLGMSGLFAKQMGKAAGNLITSDPHARKLIADVQGVQDVLGQAHNINAESERLVTRLTNKRQVPTQPI